MSVKFKNNSYFNTVCKNISFNQIVDKSSKNVSFKIGDANFKNFKPNYSSRGLFFRKITTLPSAICTGTFNSIYLIFKLIIIGLPKTIFVNKSYIKVHVFKVIRNLQNTYGRIATFFNDRYGQFHIQESQFHKNCYDLYKPSKIKPFRKTIDPKGTKKGKEKNPTDEIKNPNLFDDLINDNKRNDLDINSNNNKKFEKKEIQNKNKEEETKTSKFEEMKKEKDESENKSSNVKESREDLKQPTKNETNSNSYEFLFNAFNQLFSGEKNVNLQNHKGLQTNLLEYKNLNSETRKELINDCIPDNKNIFTLPHINIPLDEYINTADERILSHITLLDIYSNNSILKFAFMKDSELKELVLRDLLKISNNNKKFIKERVEWIISENKDDEEINEIDFNNIKLIKLSKINNEYIEKNYNLIPPLAFLFFTSNQIRNLKLSNLSLGINTMIFTNPSEIDKRIELYEEEDILNAIYKNVLPEKILSRLTKEQVKKLKLSNLSKEQFEIIFSEKGIHFNDQLFKNFELKDIEEAIIKEMFKPLYLNLLSAEELKGLELSKLSKRTIDYLFDIYIRDKNDKEKFSVFSSKDVNEALTAEKITSQYHLSLLSDEQLKGLELSKLSKTIIEDLFPSYKGDKNDKQRFSFLSVKEVNEALCLEKITTRYHLSLLSEEHLKGLELFKLPPKTIDNLFPQNKNDKEKFSLLSAEEVNIALMSVVITKEYHLSLLSDDHLSALELSKLPSSTIERLFDSNYTRLEIKKEKFSKINVNEIVKALNSNLISKNFILKFASKEQLEALKSGAYNLNITL